MTTKDILENKMLDSDWKQVYEELCEQFKDEPRLLSGSRVNEILDIGTTSRFNLTRAGKLTKVKLGEKIQHPAKCTKESVLMLLCDWELK